MHHPPARILKSMDTLRQTYNRLFRKEQIVENDVDHEAQRVIELLQQRQRAPLDGDLDDEDARNGKECLTCSQKPYYISYSYYDSPPKQLVHITSVKRGPLTIAWNCSISWIAMDPRVSLINSKLSCPFWLPV